METVGLEAQVLLLAVRVNGDVSWAPLAGAVTVMADAGTMLAASATAAKRKFFMGYTSMDGRPRSCPA